MPGTAELGFIGGLGFAPDIQCLTGRSEQGKVAATSRGLDRPDPQLAVDALDLLPDANLAVLLVHVLPADPEHFAATQPVQEQQEERRVERIAGGCSKLASMQAN